MIVFWSLHCVISYEVLLYLHTVVGFLFLNVLSVLFFTAFVLFAVYYVRVVSCMFLVFFFFKQKTAYEMRISDWSSDVCSSDLSRGRRPALRCRVRHRAGMRPCRVFGHPCQRRSRLRAGNGGPRTARADGRGAENGAGRTRRKDQRGEIGRASCRERVCQYV